MTPLHYAARYSSAAMIRLLVEHEASIFSAARRGNDPEFGDAEYPLDWLREYAGDATEAERNPNLTAAELPALIKLLRVPTVAEQHLSTAKLVTRAQADYARGEFERAYRRLQMALSAQPDNEKAIADLPLVALRAGHLDAAIEAANRAIGGLSDPASQASAWFNKGLACEQQAAMPNESGNKACDTDWIRSFATAWKLHPTPARANQLKQLFNKYGVGVCKSPSGLVDKKIWSLQSDFAGGRIQRIYVLHRANDPMDLQSARGAVRAAKVKGIPVSPRIVDRFVLGDEIITVLEDELGSLPPVINGEPCLMPLIDAGPG
jgi:tetratricopeptide (TPR) repeat protein